MRISSLQHPCSRVEVQSLVCWNKMSFKSILRELKEVKDGIGSISRRNRAKTHIAPDQAGPPPDSIDQSPWANLPPELLLDIIRRVEENESTWPARAVVVFCASVCRSWREITKEAVKSPEHCGRLTFPISLKQPGPRQYPIQCFIKRDRGTSTYVLYHGLVPSENEKDKLLLAARKIRKATRSEFIISTSLHDFTRTSHTYVGKLRSSFLGTKFTIYDSQGPPGTSCQTTPRSSRTSHSKQVIPKSPACNYTIGTVSYELNVLRTRGPRRTHCVLDSIPVSSILGATSMAHTDTDGQAASSQNTKVEESLGESNSSSAAQTLIIAPTSVEPLVLKNKPPRWHEQLQCWCLNFKGRVTVASVKNFQLVAAFDPSLEVPVEEQERVILQFGKIGKDIFTMDYRYPLSAFQAFAICISSFDTKPACEG